MKKIITAFKEHKEFGKNKPWDVNNMYFPSNIITPPHYAETIEILLCYNISGTAHIGGRHFELKGKQAFFIAPNVIHSMEYQKNNGTVVVVKLHPTNLMPLINLKNILSEEKLDFHSLTCYLPEYDHLSELVEQLRTSNSITIEALSNILHIFHILIQHSHAKNSFLPQVPIIDNTLQEIITWTENHYSEKISLDNIAQKTGYNKNYFCNKFKNATGETYLQYLNNLRMFHACKLLKTGHSITQTCDICGFENIPYFIQLFKKIVGTTPKKYADSSIKENLE